MFILNSDHPGYAPADSVMTGIYNTLITVPNVVLDTLYLDFRNQKSENEIRQQNERAYKAIKKYNPDVIVAYGDEAIKYVIAPHFRKGPFPVVFCGVKDDCSQYGLPTEYVTGILEIQPVEETVQILRQYYPELRKMTILSENSVAERKNIKNLNSRLLELGITVDYELTDQYDKWQNAFLRANRDADVVYFSNNRDISNWNDSRAYDFVFRNIRKPVFTCNQFMMRFAVFGISNVDRSQGEWAAKAVLRIISGEKVKNIPLAKELTIKRFFNSALAERIQFKPKPYLLQTTEILK